MSYFRYLRYIVRHRWFVMLECFKYGLYWQGLIHDLSKLLPSEFFPYANFFYGDREGSIKKGRDETGYYKPTDTGDNAFDFAWLLHQKRNKHHWQWWLTTTINRRYNSRRDLFDEELTCDYTRPIKLKSFASLVDLNVLYQIFRIRQDNTGRYAQNIGMSTASRKEKNERNQANNRNMIKNGIGRILNCIEKKQKERQQNIGVFVLSFMGALYLFALAVVNKTTSFCALTILMEEETNIEKSLKNQDLLYIVGLLKENFQKDFVSFVPIVIRHMDITGIVHTIAVEDKGGLKVVEMPLKYRLEMLCDWRGAGRAQGTPDVLRWYEKNRNRMILGMATQIWIEQQLYPVEDLKAKVNE